MSVGDVDAAGDGVRRAQLGADGEAAGHLRPTGLVHHGARDGVHLDLADAENPQGPATLVGERNRHQPGIRGAGPGGAPSAQPGERADALPQNRALGVYLAELEPHLVRLLLLVGRELVGPRAHRREHQGGQVGTLTPAREQRQDDRLGAPFRSAGKVAPVGADRVSAEQEMAPGMFGVDVVGEAVHRDAVDDGFVRPGLKVAEARAVSEFDPDRLRGQRPAGQGERGDDEGAAQAATFDGVAHPTALEHGGAADGDVFAAGGRGGPDGRHGSSRGMGMR
ncbi:hypothetical protein AB0N09_35790 [Streptomyces erythrochromogenes]|uniref:hypothetical protein n=1 Tax=Streptomyces erythrochromogenes TaxID=285574 RepID=UPI003416AB27